MGYGLDGDSWAVALSAIQWNSTGIYDVSRFPGYPVHEFLCHWFVMEEYWTLNVITALVSTMGITFFVKALEELRFKMPFLAGFALAGIPAVFIHSTTVIDYNIALAFQLMAFYFLVTRRWVLTGIALGMAIGTRLTSGALLLPFVIMVLDDDGLRPNLERIFRFAFPALLIGACWYSPVYQRYGLEFLTYYDVPYPSIPKVMYKFFLEVWGILGVLAVMVALLSVFFSERWIGTEYLFPKSVNLKYVVAWLVAIDLFIIAFIKLPMESGYLVPVVPFIILLIGRYVSKPVFVFTAVLMTFSSLLFSITPLNRMDSSTPSSASVSFRVGGEALVLDVLKGPALAYYSRRENGMQYSRQVLKVAKRITRPTLIVCGQWYNQLISMNRDTLSGHVLFAPHINSAELARHFLAGRKILFLPGQERFNEQIKGVNPVVFGATMLDTGSLR